MKLILQIAVGVCLGIMLSSIIIVALWGTIFLKLLLPALSTPVSSVAQQAPVVTPPKMTTEEIAKEIVKLQQPAANADDLLAKSAAIPSPENTPPATTTEPQTTEQQPTTPQQITPPPKPVAEIRLAGKNASTEQATAVNAAEQRQKEARFRAYYQKSERCLSPGDPETRVACGNEYIRAKAKFEELYKQGKF
jgi:hypothetical protein